MSKRKPKIGDIVEVEWIDATSHTNTKLSDAVPARAVNIGIWIKDEESYIVLQTGYYQTDILKEREYDTVVIPKGWGQKMKVLIGAE